MRKTPPRINTRLRAVYQEIRNLRARARLVRRYKNALLAVDPDISFSGYGSFLDLDRLEHEQIVRLMLLFGGKWNKTPNDGRIDYTRTEPIDGITIRFWSGALPPNCRVVETQELVPAIPSRMMTVRKIVCDGQEVKE